ncbi:PTS sugar transporter subunit IIA [Xanthomonas oryzae pv. oryzicola]|uniref:PTS sugar transporter subunit IIA n=1 Tax=Xanthomonas oryzae TaxID=347 RepID=UPI0003F868B8|nr:PTS sugar transporter subunit IIA [Xanthomonas oryzae]AJQ88419.1 PTS fructose transporter subunit IIA [Xanthomonas oryzae pv. oryzicola]AKK63376.1 PTS fructose transporter subunit IIA [Xanthomonas oryzae pv. oryzicola]AKO01494.1 PTS fructose transporter subunit IIA [Xanthomonas oryzae pv. oryzicola]AKO05321.1 PTS fructose transporter subunit IIA [Xanthomonas oryzae pv. oryzicola]AKO09207.1 PTS fructose transporter subunit IIA [Xanthomonas oryzae pv. oryzicola]
MPFTDLMAAVRTVVSPAADRDTVLHTAANLLSCRQAGADELYANLCEREALGSTAIGHGIAIPHGRCPNLTEPRGALLRLDTPVAFGGDEPVDLIFAMAVPAHYTHQHLMLLSELAERFSDADFRQRLRAAPNAEALMGLLTNVPPPQASAA